jgi:ADP-heptose:LPS heptosyltransferase
MEFVEFDKSKILVVRVGRAGDMVMITPALRALLVAYPEAEFHLLTSDEGKRILHNFDPRITRFAIYHHGTLWGSQEYRSQLKCLREEHYDRAFVFEGKWQFHRLIKKSVKTRHLLHFDPPERHYCDRCLEVVQEALTFPTTKTPVYLPVSEEGRRHAGEFLRMNGIEDNCLLVGLNPTHSKALAESSGLGRPRIHKAWPATNFIKLTHSLKQYADGKGIPLSVVIDALPEERQIVEPIAEGSGGVIRVLSGTPDFERYKGVLERMALLVTPDTGPMHIAAAVGVPVVALFSRKSPADCGPYTPREKHAVLRAEDMPNGKRGLAAIPPEAVFRACLPFLSSAGSRER